MPHQMRVTRCTADCSQSEEQVEGDIEIRTDQPDTLLLTFYCIIAAVILREGNDELVLVLTGPVGPHALSRRFGLRGCMCARPAWPVTCASLLRFLSGNVLVFLPADLAAPSFGERLPDPADSAVVACSQALHVTASQVIVLRDSGLSTGSAAQLGFIKLEGEDVVTLRVCEEKFQVLLHHSTHKQHGAPAHLSSMYQLNAG